TFDQHLMELVKSEKVEFPVAKAAATNPSDFDLKMNMFSEGGSGGVPKGSSADDMSHLFGS
ncbi:MAG: hypothetical protein ACOC8K_08480, partial [Gemmatimonadota bacterium]